MNTSDISKMILSVFFTLLVKMLSVGLKIFVVVFAIVLIYFIFKTTRLIFKTYKRYSLQKKIIGGLRYIYPLDQYRNLLRYHIRPLRRRFRLKSESSKQTSKKPKTKLKLHRKLHFKKHRLSDRRHRTYPTFTPYFLKTFMNERYWKIVDFPKWVLYDLLQGKDFLRLFGIWCFTGYYGQGKTLGAVSFARNLRDKHPQRNIKIYTNFTMYDQDGKITCWEDLLNLPKNTIVIFDEIQSTFTSQKFKDFPIELLWKLTQCRKHKLAIFCSSPVYTRMSIQLRESTDFIIRCSNVMDADRWFNYDFYHADVYERFMDIPEKLKKYRKFRYSIIARNIEYNQYNTHEEVQRWDIVPADQPKNSKQQDYSKFKDLLVKEIEHRMKDVEKRLKKLGA